MSCVYLRPEVENDDCLVAHRNDPPGAYRRSGAISRYYNGVASRLTTICCSALALITALTGVSSAQARRVKQTYAADDRTPLPLFPLQTLWTLALNSSLTATPGFDATRAYFPLEGDRLAAYELATGTRLWLTKIHTTFEPAAGDDLVFVVRPGGLSALRAADGTSAWELPLAEMVAVPPVWDNGWLLVATMSNDVLAFRAADGTLLWRRNVGAVAHARPALAGEHLYLPASDSRVVAMRIDTGELVWERRLGGAANEILVSGDRLYLGSQDRFFYCLNTRDGAVEWRWQTGGPVIGLPVVDDRTAYFVSLDNVLRALNKSNGVQRWKIPLPLRPRPGRSTRPNRSSSRDLRRCFGPTGPPTVKPLVSSLSPVNSRRRRTCSRPCLVRFRW